MPSVSLLQALCGILYTGVPCSFHPVTWTASPFLNRLTNVVSCLAFFRWEGGFAAWAFKSCRRVRQRPFDPRSRLPSGRANTAWPLQSTHLVACRTRRPPRPRNGSEWLLTPPGEGIGVAGQPLLSYRYSTILHHTILYHTILYYTMLYYAIL